MLRGCGPSLAVLPPPQWVRAQAHRPGGTAGRRLAAHVTASGPGPLRIPPRAACFSRHRWEAEAQGPVRRPAFESTGCPSAGTDQRLHLRLQLSLCSPSCVEATEQMAGGAAPPPHESPRGCARVGTIAHARDLRPKQRGPARGPTHTAGRPPKRRPRKPNPRAQGGGERVAQRVLRGSTAGTRTRGSPRGGAEAVARAPAALIGFCPALVTGPPRAGSRVGPAQPLTGARAPPPLLCRPGEAPPVSPVAEAAAAGPERPSPRARERPDGGQRDAVAAPHALARSTAL